MSTEELRLEIDRVVGECAGAVSMCWEPRPEGVFDSTQATTYVRGAADRIMSVLEAEIASREAEGCCYRGPECVCKDSAP